MTLRRRLDGFLSLLAYKTRKRAHEVFVNCAVNDPKMLVPLFQGGHPCGRDYRGQFVQAQRCPCCSYVRFPDPPEGLLDAFYSKEYPEYCSSWYNLVADYAPYKTERRAEAIIGLIQRFGMPLGTSLHEFGCAFGGTVHALNAKGYDASGTELNSGAVAEARAYGNTAIHDISALDYLEARKGQMEVVYSYHAIEHFPDPFSFIKSMATLIHQDGLIILVVPNAAALFAMVYGLGRYVWFGYPEHLHLFSPRSALSFAERVGCSLVHLEGREYGIQPELTAAALTHDSGAAVALRGAERSLLGEELYIVLTPNGGGTATKYAREIEQTRARVLAFGAYERMALDANESETVNPWPAPAPAL